MIGVDQKDDGPLPLLLLPVTLVKVRTILLIL